MSFVHVKHVRLDAERAERFHAADAEHDFLAHAHLEIAAIKLRGDQAVFGVVFRNIGIEQVEIDAADVQFPDLGENFAIQNRALKSEASCRRGALRGSADDGNFD